MTVERLEVVTIPVSDVERAKEFYARLGWRLDHTPPTKVQFTPPGSSCSVQFGTGLTTATPGSAQNMYLCVPDIVATRGQLTGLGVEVGNYFHTGGATPQPGLHPERESYRSHFPFRDPDGNSWLVQEVTTRLPGRVDRAAAALEAQTMPAPAPADPTSGHRDVENLIARYAKLVDDGDFAGLGILLAEATFAGSGTVVRGRDAIEKMFRDMLIIYSDGTPRTQHVTTNLAIEVDEGAGTAVARSYVTVLQALPEQPLQPIAGGRYHDRFERRDGHWIFVERRVRINLVGDVSRHLRQAT